MTDAAAGRPRAWLAFFWVASSAGIGSLAGLPWLWFVSGPLPAAVFASFAAAESWRLWRAPSASLENVRASALWGVGAALVAFVFANPTGHTWLDRCFDVWNGSEDVTMSWRLAVAGGASVVFCAIALGLGALAQRLRAASSDGSAQAIDGALSRCAAWLAASAAAWSVVNEVTMTRIMGGFRTSACEPEVGRVAAFGYAGALAALAYVTARAAEQRRLVEEGPSGAVDARARALARARLVACVCALAGAALATAAQSARSWTILRARDAALQRCGGREGCGCTSCRGWPDWRG